MIAGSLGIARHDERKGYAALAFALIALDLAVLWLESPAKWRFSHVFLFLNVNPASPLWWGAWGLVLAAAGALGVLFLRRWQSLTAILLTAGGTVALLYPGMALVANASRPLWPGILAALFPATALLMVLAIAVLAGSAWARPWLLASGAASATLAVLYPLTLLVGDLAAREAASHAIGEAGPYYLLSAIALGGAAVARRSPRAAAWLAIAGAVGLRGVIVAAGQVQGIGF